MAPALPFPFDAASPGFGLLDFLALAVFLMDAGRVDLAYCTLPYSMVSWAAEVQ